MKTFLLCASIVLWLWSAPVYAEWVLAGTDPNTRMDLYVNPDAIHRSGDMVKMWELYDYKTARPINNQYYFSSKVQNQYDCTEERRRPLAAQFFSNNMGKGKVALHLSDDTGTWAPLAPDSEGQSLWKIACEKQ